MTGILPLVTQAALAVTIVLLMDMGIRIRVIRTGALVTTQMTANSVHLIACNQVGPSDITLSQQSPTNRDLSWTSTNDPRLCARGPT